MPSGSVSLYNVGSLGVDLTKSKIHADDGSLQRAQNAVPDMRGEAGGLTKRDGLVAINSSTAGGSITGALDVPLPAPAITSITARRILYLGGERTNGSNRGVWWASIGGTNTYPTVDPTNFITSFGEGIYSTLPGPKEPAFSKLTALAEANSLITGVTACVWNNTLYYVGEYTQSTDSPPIRAFKTTDVDTAAAGTDSLVNSVPVNPDVAAVSKGVLHMLTEGSYIYISTWDVGTSSATHKGSVYRLDPKIGAFVKLGATFPVGFVPYCLAWWLGRLWAGTYSEDKTGSGRVYWIRPGIDSAWTLDHTTTAGQGEIFSLIAYKGELYAATKGSSGSAGLVKKRTTTGTWSTSQTGPSTAADQGYLSLTVFGDNLYASYKRVTAASSGRIEKYNGTSWSTVDSTNQQFNLFTDQTRIFAVPHNVSTANQYLYSSDGTTWTTATSITPHFFEGSQFGVLLE